MSRFKPKSKSKSQHSSTPEQKMAELYRGLTDSYYLNDSNALSRIRSILTPDDYEFFRLCTTYSRDFRKISRYYLTPVAAVKSRYHDITATLENC